MEKYTPTEEEVKKGEEMMTPSQEKLSEARALYMAELAKLGLSQDKIDILQTKWDNGYDDEGRKVGFFELLVDGKRIIVRNDGIGFLGRIKNHEMSAEQAKKVWDKFFDLAIASDFLRDHELTTEQTVKKEINQEVVAADLKELSIE